MRTNRDAESPGKDSCPFTAGEGWGELQRIFWVDGKLLAHCKAPACWVVSGQKPQMENKAGFEETWSHVIEKKNCVCKTNAVERSDL